MKDIRFEYDIKQREIAQVLGIAKSTYNQYEQQYDIIPLKHLVSFSNHFNLSIDYLLGLTKIRQYDDIRPDIDLKVSGQRLRKSRRENNLKQIELAKKLHITNSIISHYEKGKFLISTATLYSLSKLYNISADYLLNRTDYKYLNTPINN